MNCKPGDLAVVVRPVCVENLGLLVHVVGPGVQCDWHVEPLCKPSIGVGLLTGAVERVGSRPIYCEADDAQLRPIRDQDGEDETLTWAGKPQQVPA